MNQESPKKEKKMIEFKEIRKDIEIALNERIKLGVFTGEDKGVTLIDGIFMQPIQNSISGNFIIGGPSVPVVGVVSNKSGRIYYFVPMFCSIMKTISQR